MTTYVPLELRRLVVERARQCCEYCRVPSASAYFGCQLDHVIAEKHGGETSADNLALACADCNRRKGSDIASLSPITGTLSRLFHPRLDDWSHHFDLKGPVIVPKSDVGWTTAHLLEFNTRDRILERLKLQKAELYPTS